MVMPPQYGSMADRKTIEEYTGSGVYYDHEAGEFTSFVETYSNVGFVLPEEFDRDPFHTFAGEGIESLDRIADTLQSDFTEISEETVENPARTVEAAVRIVIRNDIEELGNLSVQESLNLQYAWEQVEIKEKE